MHKIFELIEKRGKAFGYNDRHPDTFKLQELEKPYDMQKEHASEVLAYEEIFKNRESLKHKSLAIIPVIRIDWEGEIVDE